MSFARKALAPLLILTHAVDCLRQRPGYIHTCGCELHFHVTGGHAGRFLISNTDSHGTADPNFHDGAAYTSKHHCLSDNYFPNSTVIYYYPNPRYDYTHLHAHCHRHRIHSDGRSQFYWHLVVIIWPSSVMSRFRVERCLLQSRIL